MQDFSTPFLQDIYSQHLRSLNGINFTKREIDVMAGTFNARNTGKISSLLLIDKRTVETHIRNIMLKIGCNSRESIIDFIEKSDKILIMRKYYSVLRLNALFDRTLKQISKIISHKEICCTLICSSNDKSPFNIELKSHLKLSGITVFNKVNKTKKSNIFIIVPPVIKENELKCLIKKSEKFQNKIFLVLRNNFNTIKFLEGRNNFKILDFSQSFKYYLSFLEIFKNIVPEVNLNKICEEFYDQFKKISEELKFYSSLNSFSNNKIFLGISSYKKKLFLASIILFTFLGSGFFIFKNYQQYSLRSELALPHQSVFLNRSEILNKIEDGLKRQNSDIRTIAIIGPGGSGKTILARQYARQTKARCIWELNAESRETLIKSLENFSQTLATNSEDEQHIQRVMRIKDLSERSEKFIKFIKNHLKTKSNWILIFDNVEEFRDIQDYFPYNDNNWGEGKLIITSRNNNLQHNKYIFNNLIINELSPQQKLELFNKIIINDKSSFFTKQNKNEVKKFLEKIPSFPLDVSIAAYYIKATHINYATYVKQLSQHESNFEKLHENLQKDIDEYGLSRKNIITTSLEKIINKHIKFKELLFFMTLINFHNIPAQLIENLTDDIIANDFIQNLKKYSLINSESSSSSLKRYFSIHRSTQEIIFSYFVKKISSEERLKLINNISTDFIKYLQKILKEEDLEKMQEATGHCENFLKHKQFLNPLQDGTLLGLLGIIQYYFGNLKIAATCLNDSLLQLTKYGFTNSIYYALSLGFLGNVYRDQGNYKKAKILLQESLSIYNKNPSIDPFRYAYFLSYLGIVERILGNYKNAAILFKQGLKVHDKYFSQNENYKAWVTGQIGIIDKELGKYDESKLALEESLNFFRKERNTNHFDIAWALEHLGTICCERNEYVKAENCLKESLQIYSTYFLDNIGLTWVSQLMNLDSVNSQETETLFNKLLTLYHSHFHDVYIYAAWNLKHLGIVYSKLGNHMKGQQFLNYSLTIYQKNYGGKHLEIADILNALGNVYLCKGELDNSEACFLEALDIYVKETHVYTYKVTENLANLYQEKSKNACKNADSIKDQYYKNLSRNYLQQALAIVKTHFEENCPHRIRIQQKIKSLDFKLT